MVDHDPLQRADPEWAEAMQALVAVVEDDGALDARMRALIGVAVAAAATHLNERALRRHLRAAFAAGVKVEELLEVLDLVSVLGIHACTMAMPMLVEQLGDDAPAPGPEADAVRERFLAGRDLWPPFFAPMAALDAKFLDAYLDFSTVPWKKGRLGAVERELLYIAIDANVTHLYETGTRMHIANALRAGARPEHVLAVLRVVATLGAEALAMAVPLLDD